MTRAANKRFSFGLDLQSGVPVYRQIIDQVVGGVASGVLAGGDQLPTVRQLAVDLLVNPNTVVRAYRELEIRGVLETQQGTGTFISHLKVERDELERQRQLTQLVNEFMARAVAPGSRSGICWSDYMTLKTTLEARGDDVMKLGRGRFTLNGVAVTLFAVSIVIGALVTAAVANPAPAVIGLLIGLYLLFSIKVADQWEKVAVLRLGRYLGLRGPGLFHVIPVVDTLSRFVDQRVRVASVTAESTLTRDTVPVNVDAIVFWLVWNAEKSILEVEDFVQAITMSAQTALRESIGRHQLSQMITERESMGRELQRILDEKTNAWGITVQSVEIRDVRIPQALEDAMSRQAQAERERQARNILGQAETEISEKFSQAALTYQNNPVALHLRAMNMLYEAIKERGSMVIVPSSAVETMGLGGTLATAALGGAKPE